MTQVRAYGRFTSVAVIVAVVAVAVLMTCGAAFGAPAVGGAISGSGACAMDSHRSMRVAGVSVESPRITAETSAVLPAPFLAGIPQSVIDGSAAVSAELPPPPDPRHGRIRV